MSWIQQLQNTNWPRWYQTMAVGFGSYLLGCFTMGYYLVRIRMGVDIREIGSGCVGAKNVGRTLGKSAFILTALSDFGKGSLAVWLTWYFSMDIRLTAIAVLFVVVGHVWPAQLRFHGGKGVSTLLGALLIYDFHLALTFVILFAVAYIVMRKTVLPGLFGVACLPFADAYFNRDPGATVIISVSAALVLFTHRKNIMDEIAQIALRRHMHTHSDQF